MKRRRRINGRLVPLRVRAGRNGSLERARLRAVYRIAPCRRKRDHA